MLRATSPIFAILAEAASELRACLAVSVLLPWVLRHSGRSSVLLAVSERRIELVQARREMAW